MQSTDLCLIGATRYKGFQTNPCRVKSVAQMADIYVHVR